MTKYGIISCDEIFWFSSFETALHDYVVSTKHVQEMFNLGLLTKEYAFQLLPRLISSDCEVNYVLVQSF